VLIYWVLPFGWLAGAEVAGTSTDTPMQYITFYMSLHPSRTSLAAILYPGRSWILALFLIADQIVLPMHIYPDAEWVWEYGMCVIRTR
jgi:hypothetical protein